MDTHLHKEIHSPLAAPGPPGRPVFLYDWSCGLCRTGVAWLLRRGAAGSLDFQPYQECPDERRRAGLTLSDCGLAAAVVESLPPASVKVHRGAQAVGLALRRLPGLRSLGWRLLGGICLLPFVRQIGDRVYRCIAVRRRREGPPCSVPESSAGEARGTGEASP